MLCRNIRFLEYFLDYYKAWECRHVNTNMEGREM